LERTQKWWAPHASSDGASRANSGRAIKLSSGKQQHSIRFVNSTHRSNLKLQDSNQFSPLHYLPELRGEWVRKDLGKERKEVYGVSERKSAARSQCSRMFKSSVTAPVWGFNTHPSGPKRHVCRLGLLWGRRCDDSQAWQRTDRRSPPTICGPIRSIRGSEPRNSIRT